MDKLRQKISPNKKNEAASPRPESNRPNESSAVALPANHGTADTSSRYGGPVLSLPLISFFCFAVLQPSNGLLLAVSQIVQLARLSLARWRNLVRPFLLLLLLSLLFYRLEFLTTSTAISKALSSPRPSSLLNHTSRLASPSSLRDKLGCTIAT